MFCCLRRHLLHIWYSSYEIESMWNQQQLFRSKKKPPFQESGLGFLKEKKNSTPNKIKSMKWGMWLCIVYGFWSWLAHMESWVVTADEGYWYQLLKWEK
jgi:hypothetical protein